MTADTICLIEGFLGETRFSHFRGREHLAGYLRHCEQPVGVTGISLAEEDFDAPGGLRFSEFDGPDAPARLRAAVLG